uniref:Glutamic acid-rich protein-like n=1 Tax=Tanacetum cinerariifolium TaxID=118510 RepID=A0A699HPJ1_TANCI|nr:hypothetical protein [Tanacetum cinerariifolium]
MGYEKPSTKLTFYKAFFSPQWKFLIHTILKCMSAKRTSWNEFSSCMASAFTCLSTGRKFNFSKYIFDSLVRNVDSSTKFYMYARFLQLMIRAQVDDLSSHTTKYSSPSLTQKVFANMRKAGKGFSRVETPLFKCMIVAQQADDVADEGTAGVDVDAVPAAANEHSIHHIHLLINHYHHHKNYLPPHKKVEALEQDKVAQAYEIIQLKQRVKKLEKKNMLKVSGLSAARRRKRVVIRDPKETTTSSIIIHFEPKSKDKGKRIMRKEKEDNVMLRYQALKMKPQTEAQAKKNMIIYLRNMAGFKMDYFKGMSYDDIRPIFKKYFNSNVAFLEKTKEQIKEEDNRALKRTSESLKEKAAKKQKLDEEVEELKKHLQIVPNNDDDVYTKATPLALKVPVVDYAIHTENNKPYFKIIRANRTH